MRDSNPQGREAGSFQDCCITNYANPPCICKELFRRANKIMNERKKSKTIVKNQLVWGVRGREGKVRSDETQNVSPFGSIDYSHPTPSENLLR